MYDPYYPDPGLSQPTNRRSNAQPYSGDEYRWTICWAIPAKHLPDEICFGTTEPDEIRIAKQPQLRCDPFDFPRMYRTANRSILAFDSMSRTTYAMDLIFDADAKVPKEAFLFEVDGRTVTAMVDTEPGVEQTAAALRVIAPIVDLLLGSYKIDPNALTLVATRRGVQLHVDWTAFGPIRIHEAGLVVVALAREAGVPTDLDEGEHAAKLDTGFYTAKDDNKAYLVDCEEGTRPFGTLIGKPIRAVGALHHKSGSVVYRSTPVPLKWRNRPDLLFKVSRMSRRDFEDGQSFPFARLTDWLLPRVRASRNPALWTKPVALCTRLIDLYERIASGKVTPPGGAFLRRKGEGVRVRPQGSADLVEIDAERIAKLIERAGRRAVRESGEQVVPDGCLVCGKSGKATFWIGSGTYNCFSCDGNASKSFAFMCALANAGDLIPRGASALKPITLADSGTAPKPIEVTPNQTHVAADLNDAWRVYDQIITGALAEPNSAHAVVSPPGTGKSTGIQAKLMSRSIIYRSFVPRRDTQRDWVARDPEAVALYGMRTTGGDLNCQNPEAERVRLQGDSPGKLVCPTCPFRKECRASGYRSQEFGGASGMSRSLVLTHAHLPLADMVKFDNGAGISVVDEGAFQALVTTDKIERRTLHDYRILNVFASLPGIVEFGFDTLNVSVQGYSPAESRIWLKTSEFCDRTAWQSLEGTSPAVSSARCLFLGRSAIRPDHP